MKKNEVTVAQARALTGYPRQKLYSLIANNEIAARKPGGWQIWIDRSSLLAYVAKHQKLATAEK